MRNHFFEVPFIANYRKEYVKPELDLYDLWKIWLWDEKVCVCGLACGCVCVHACVCMRACVLASFPGSLLKNLGRSNIPKSTAFLANVTRLSPPPVLRREPGTKATCVCGVFAYRYVDIHFATCSYDVPTSLSPLSPSLPSGCS